MTKGQSSNSLKTFSSSGHSGVRQNNDDLVNGKLLIDCGEDQDCVLGKFFVDNFFVSSKFQIVTSIFMQNWNHASLEGGHKLISGRTVVIVTGIGYVSYGTN